MESSVLRVSSSASSALMGQHVIHESAQFRKNSTPTGVVERQSRKSCGEAAENDLQRSCMNITSDDGAREPEQPHTLFRSVDTRGSVVEYQWSTYVDAVSLPTDIEYPFVEYDAGLSERDARNVLDVFRYCGPSIARQQCG